jgi:hypothetical protein
VYIYIFFYAELSVLINKAFIKLWTLTIVPENLTGPLTQAAAAATIILLLLLLLLLLLFLFVQ